LKHEVRRKAINVALNRLIQRRRLHLLQGGKLAIYQNLLVANDRDLGDGGIPVTRCKLSQAPSKWPLTLPDATHSLLLNISTMDATHGNRQFQRTR
jgi:hypothetical protein